jgi:hypothetical protein
MRKSVASPPSDNVISAASGSTHHTLNSTLSPRAPEKSRQFTGPAESASQDRARTKSEWHPNCKPFGRIKNSRMPPIHCATTLATIGDMDIATEGINDTRRSSTIAHSGGSTTPVDMKGM